MVYILDKLFFKWLGLLRKFIMIEFLVIQFKFGWYDVLIVGIYRLFKLIGNNYYVIFENDFYDLILWVLVQKILLVIIGDLNFDRF